MAPSPTMGKEAMPNNIYLAIQPEQERSFVITHLTLPVSMSAITLCKEGRLKLRPVKPSSKKC